jgi:hypothetical protein
MSGLEPSAAGQLFDRLGDHVTDLGRFLEDNMGWTIGTGVSLLLISIGFTAWMLIKLPDDHFAVPHAPNPNILVRIGKNVGGVILILVGIVLSLPGVPGQGFLTILIGLMLTDIPGKRRVELFVLRRATVYAAISKLRARYGREPLALPGGPLASKVDDEAAASSARPAGGSALSRAASDAAGSSGASASGSAARFAGTSSGVVAGGDATAGSTRP